MKPSTQLKIDKMEMLGKAADRSISPSEKASFIRQLAKLAKEVEKELGITY